MTLVSGRFYTEDSILSRSMTHPSHCHLPVSPVIGRVTAAGKIGISCFEPAIRTVRIVAADDGTAGTDIQLGAWMEHGHFRSRQISAEGLSPSYYGDRTNYGYAYGALTRSASAAGATWRGVMVGGQAFGGGGGGLDGHMLIGNAELDFDMESGTLDARFSGIANADRPGEPHSVTGVILTGVPMDAASGTFRRGVDDDHIQGGFHSPEHAETVGVFEKAGIVASFGARRE